MGRIVGRGWRDREAATTPILPPMRPIHPAFNAFPVAQSLYTCTLCLQLAKWNPEAQVWWTGIPIKVHLSPASSGPPTWPPPATASSLLTPPLLTPAPLPSAPACHLQIMTAAAPLLLSAQKAPSVKMTTSLLSMSPASHCLYSSSQPLKPSSDVKVFPVSSLFAQAVYFHTSQSHQLLQSQYGLLTLCNPD